MKSLNKSVIIIRACAGILWIISTCICTVRAQAPTHTMKTSPFIDNNVNGFWEYLPRNYNRDLNQKYPLIIFFHGYGDSGSTPDSLTLSMVLNAGTPKIINNGTFPDSFYVAGTWHKFIVVSPQIKNGFDGDTRTSIVSPATINALINYATSAYRVDISRIYLCGLSMGGGIAWDYPASSENAANKLAAIAVAAGAAILDTAQSDNIARAFLPVLATHNTVDDVIPVTRTIDNIDKLKVSKTKFKNSPNKPAIDPDPLAFYWDTPGTGGDLGDNHNAWSRTFEDILPGSTAGGNLRDVLGFNVYEWLLQYTRSISSPLSLLWENFTVIEFNHTASLHWTTSHELNVKSFTIEKSSDGHQWSAIAMMLPQQGNALLREYSFIDNEPFPAITYYRIKELDMDEKASYSVIKKIEKNNAISNIKIFPNPFDKQVSLNFSKPQSTSTISVKILDSKGAVLRNEKHTLASGNTIISLQDLHSLNAGWYYITITDEKGRILGKEKIIKN